MILTKAATTGISRVTVALLLVTSVMNETIRHITPSISQLGRTVKVINCSPNQVDKPDFWREE